MNKMFAISLISLSLSSVALAGVKVTSVDLTTKGNNGYVNISLDGRSNDLPDVKVYGKVIEITISQADKFDSIFKNVKGAQLSANNLNGKAVIKAVLPYEIPSKSVNLGWKNSNIELIFPRTAPLNPVVSDTAAPVINDIKSTRPVSPAGDRKVENKISKDLLNEDYLNKLMKEDKVKKGDAAAVAAVAAVKADEVNVKQASPAKTEASGVPAAAVPKASAANDNFSFAGYAVKFSLFLAVVLGLFYGIVQLLKKGLFSRGKLGFLNNSQLIEVLSTTYVAPKRSLMIVKAHKQIFLVANSESGLTFLSEMTDTSGLMKEGEKFVTGSNFDVNLGSAENLDESESIIKLKENIMESTPVSEPKGLSKMAVAKDIVKFSDELKKKAKKLKPIEFN